VSGFAAIFSQRCAPHVRALVKDLIIRGGENIDAVSIENALYKYGRVLSCAAVAVPDARLELLYFIRPRLPAFAVPAMLVISTDPLPTNAAGNFLNASLREMATDIWEKRTGRS